MTKIGSKGGVLGTILNWGVNTFGHFWLEKEEGEKIDLRPLKSKGVEEGWDYSCGGLEWELGMWMDGAAGACGSFWFIWIGGGGEDEWPIRWAMDEHSPNGKKIGTG